MSAVEVDRVTRPVAGFDPIPSRRPAEAVQVEVVDAVPANATVIGVPAFADGAVPDRVPLDRATLEASGFSAERGQTLVLPRVDGPTIDRDRTRRAGRPSIWPPSAMRRLPSRRQPCGTSGLVVDLTGLASVDAGDRRPGRRRGSPARAISVPRVP